MRATRSCLAGTLLITMSLALDATVVAQPEDERMAPVTSYVTGVSVSGAAVWEDPVGDGGAVWEMEWSDPRLPTRMHIRNNYEGGLATHPDGAAIAGQAATAARLEGANGHWVGSGWLLVSMSGPEAAPGDEWVEWIELLTLDGEGIYEGLSATLTSSGHGGVPGPYEGFIFESDLPERPDPIEPPAE